MALMLDVNSLRGAVTLLVSEEALALIEEASIDKRFAKD
jgi:hypothetical protein